MSKKIIALSIFAAASTAVFASASLAANVAPYVTAKGGYVFENNEEAVDVKGGYFVGGALGASIDNFRAEGEIAFSNREVKGYDADLSITTFMANGYYDFKNTTQFTPYVGAGLGVAHTSVDFRSGGTTYSASENDFAYQAMAGVAFNIDAKNSVYTGYRYLAVDENSIPDSHIIEAGYRFNF